MAESVPQQRRPLKKAAPAPKIPEVAIEGPPLSDITALPQSHLGLLCGYGEAGDQAILIPFVQFRLISASEADDSEDGLELREAFAGTLAYDNVAFLIMDLVRDFRLVTSRLNTFSSGELKPEPARLTQAKRYLERTRTNLDTAIAQLGTIIDQCPPVKEEESPLKTKPKRKASSKATP